MSTTPAPPRALTPSAPLPATPAVSSAPWMLEPGSVAELDRLGRVLAQFLRAAALLHRRSTEGRHPAWIAGWLGQGKPARSASPQRHAPKHPRLPALCSVDVTLAAAGPVLTRISTRLEHIALAARLQERHASTAKAIPLGGPDGIRQALQRLCAGASRIHVVAPETHRIPLDDPAEVCLLLAASADSPSRVTLHRTLDVEPRPEATVLRRFTLETPDAAAAAARLASMARLLPTATSLFDEALWFALLWNGNLQPFWRQELGEGYFDWLRQHLPYAWVLDPTPLPPHAVIPRLGLADWTDLATLHSHAERLAIRPSLGPARPDPFPDPPGGNRETPWAATLAQALRSFSQSPHVLERIPRPALGVLPDAAGAGASSVVGEVALRCYYSVRDTAAATGLALAGALAWHRSPSRPGNDMPPALTVGACCSSHD